MRPCLDCGVTLITNRRRCLRCEKVYQRERNARPSRAKYRVPEYLLLVPSGPCHWGCGRAADTREHLRDGSIVFACRSCNSARKERKVERYGAY